MGVPSTISTDSPAARSREASRIAYEQLEAFLARSPHHWPLKIWNYIPGINEGEGDDECYRQFCIGRAEALAAGYGEQPPMPAATAIGVSESVLPFIGELIEVKSEEAEWQGAIERVLHGFALSLLVDERHYSALSSHINSHHLGQRLVYYRTGQVDRQQAKPVGTDSLVLKLNIKECNQSEWLSTELRRRFDYACVDSMQLDDFTLDLECVAVNDRDRIRPRFGGEKHHCEGQHEKTAIHSLRRGTDTHCPK